MGNHAAPIELVTGGGAEVLLSNSAFRDEWSALVARCPWATPFQGPAFVLAWYTAYRYQFEPLIVLARDDHGRLCGLIPLARGLCHRELVVAGAHQAEYRGWICDPELASTFPVDAMRWLRPLTGRAGLHFEYLPPGTPLEWLETDGDRVDHLIELHSRPTWQLGDGTGIERSLKKSGNKSRIRQLNKIGRVELVHVTDPADVTEHLDAICDWHDARIRLHRGTSPFADDPCKKAFHMALLREPALLHVTLLKVGDQVASAQFSVIKGKEVQLYLLAHNPAFDRLSPGKLHLLLLARMLVKQGFEQIDLTPGKDAYKERFANHHDQVRTLTYYASAGSWRIALLQAMAENIARRMLGAIHVTPGRAMAAVARIRRPFAVAGGALRAALHGGDVPTLTAVWLGGFDEQET